MQPQRKIQVCTDAPKLQAEMELNRYWINYTTEYIRDNRRAFDVSIEKQRLQQLVKRQKHLRKVLRQPHVAPTVNRAKKIEIKLPNQKLGLTVADLQRLHKKNAESIRSTEWDISQYSALIKADQLSEFYKYMKKQRVEERKTLAELQRRIRETIVYGNLPLTHKLRNKN